ncbi:uncharacterized protein LOC133832933 [Humulus lupulus]|uniref:uncharacterized protein LOC133832933 n=1 Tax=Humulus lupulus TaxID=3486 RepID=UPI002B40FB46|nr:uncharacterized protein LOC133832933 [Humulus lupulus]
MTSIRTSSYTIEEDVHLCHVYLDISQNPIIGINQSRDQMWARVELAYHSGQFNCEKFTNDNTNSPARFQQQGRSFNSLQSRSSGFKSPTSAPTGMSSFDLNMNEEEVPINLSKRPIGVKKAKGKQKSDEQFKKLMYQSKKLVNVIENGNFERNELLRQKVDVARMSEENKILFTDLNSISDPEFRQFIQSEKRNIYRSRAQTSEHVEQGE